MPGVADICAQSASQPQDAERRALILALRVAHVRLRLMLLDCHDIGVELKDGRLLPVEAMRLCAQSGLDALFPEGPDGD